MGRSVMGRSVMSLVEIVKEKEREMGEENWMNIVLDKLKEWLAVLEDFGASLIGKVDELFPPESRGEKLHQWVQVALPFIIVAVVLVACFCCCRYCCCRRGGPVKMMKAPGRSFMRIPRAPFESNPGSYFRGLRGRSN